MFKKVKKIWNSIFAKFKTFFKKLQFTFKPDYTARIISTNPAHKDVHPHKMLIVGNTEYKKWAYFLCPCGCKDIVLLSLSQNRHPSWTIEINEKNRPTVYPSIWRQEGCYSHFWIKDGFVKWCPNNDIGSNKL